MKFKSVIANLLCVFFLAGCASKPTSPNDTFKRITDEMQGAVGASSSRSEEALKNAMLPPLQMDLPESAKAVEPRFDLAVSHAPAQQVFMALVSGTRYSMLIPPELSGNVSLNLKNVNVREALEALRELYGYEFRFQGTRIYIQPNTLQTRIFQINYLAGTRKGKSDVQVSGMALSQTTSGSNSNSNNSSTPSQGSQGSDPSVKVSTESSSDFWKDLMLSLNMIVENGKDGRQITHNTASGVILVKGFPSDIRAVENYLKATQLVVERQVMIEAKIMQVQLNESFQSGVNWNKFRIGNNSVVDSGMVQPGVSSPTAEDILPPGVDSISPTDLGKGFFGLAFARRSFSVLMSFLETQGNVQVLSSPRIATLNNQKAVLKVGTEDYYVTGVSSSTTTSAVGASETTPTIEFSPFFSGISLDVTPQIDEDNNIVLHIHPSISDVTEKKKEIDLGKMGIYKLPQASISVSETDSVVRLQDGNIVAIGGLMKYAQGSGADGLPGTTGSIFGQIFGGSRSNYLRKSELIILIKPTIIRNDSSWKGDLNDVQNRLGDLDPKNTRPQGFIR